MQSGAPVVAKEEGVEPDGESTSTDTESTATASDDEKTLEEIIDAYSE